MTKICTACHLTNRDVAIFCRGCAKRFASDHSQRDNDIAATSVLAIGIRPALPAHRPGSGVYGTSRLPATGTGAPHKSICRRCCFLPSLQGAHSCSGTWDVTIHWPGHLQPFSFPTSR